jgi:CRP-like cAMP-binding protein
MDDKITLEEVIGFLLKTPIFSNLDPKELAEIVKILTMSHFKRGDIIFSETDSGDAVYIIYRGMVQVLSSLEQGDIMEICQLAAPSVFGEMAIIDGMERSATVRCMMETTCLVIAKDRFDRLLAVGNLAAYKLVYQIARVISTRKRQTSKELRDVYSHPEKALPILQDIIKDYSFRL